MTDIDEALLRSLCRREGARVARLATQPGGLTKGDQGDLRQIADRLLAVTAPAPPAPEPEGEDISAPPASPDPWVRAEELKAALAETRKLCEEAAHWLLCITVWSDTTQGADVWWERFDRLRAAGEKRDV